MFELLEVLMRRALLLLSVPLLLALSTVARAATPWSIEAAVPVTYQWYQDPDPKKPHVEPGTLSGLRINVGTPWYFGAGIGSYTTSLKKRQGDFLVTTGDLGITFNMLEVQGNFPVTDWLRLGVGLGAGTATYSPKTATANGYTQTWKDAPASELYFIAGVALTKSLEIVAGLHSLVAHAKVEEGPPAQTVTGDMGGYATTLGVGWRF
jgi:hypothetical protein